MKIAGGNKGELGDRALWSCMIIHMAYSLQKRRRRRQKTQLWPEIILAPTI